MFSAFPDQISELTVKTFDTSGSLQKRDLPPKTQSKSQINEMCKNYQNNWFVFINDCFLILEQPTLGISFFVVKIFNFSRPLQYSAATALMCMSFHVGGNTKHFQTSVRSESYCHRTINNPLTCLTLNYNGFGFRMADSSLSRRRIRRFSKLQKILFVWSLKRSEVSSLVSINSNRWKLFWSIS